MAKNPCKHPKKMVKTLRTPDINFNIAGWEWCTLCGATRMTPPSLAVMGGTDIRLHSWRSPKIATQTVPKLLNKIEVAGCCELCKQCHVYVCEEDPCELTPTRGEDGLLKCPSFKPAEESEEEY